jgi:hypothetical protein
MGPGACGSLTMCLRPAGPRQRTWELLSSIPEVTILLHILKIRNRRSEIKLPGQNSTDRKCQKLGNTRPELSSEQRPGPALGRRNLAHHVCCLA